MTTNTKFKPGQSGNPNGRPKGSRHKTTLAIETLLDGEGEEITRKAIDLAKGGDLGAIRICLDRLAPPRKDRHIEFSLPAMEKVKTAHRIWDRASMWMGLSFPKIISGRIGGAVQPGLEWRQ